MASSREELVRLKVGRAERHLDELHQALRAFREKQPYEIRIDDQTSPTQRLYRLHIREEVPIGLSLIVGDVIHNLRSALDHLVYQMVLSNHHGPRRSNAFPICDTRDEFDSGHAARLRGMTQDAVRAIKGLHPYKGGNDALWRIHKLDIEDKHRLLIPAWEQYQHVSIDIAAPTRHGLSEMAEPYAKPEEVPEHRIGIKPGQRFRVEEGTVVFAEPKDSKVDMKPQIALDVAFGEGEVLEGELLVPTLRQFFSLTNEVIDLLAPFLRD